MHFVAIYIFAIGLTIKELGKFVLPATFCDKMCYLSHIKSKKRSLIIKFLLKNFLFTWKSGPQPGFFEVKIKCEIFFLKHILRNKCSQKASKIIFIELWHLFTYLKFILKVIKIQNKSAYKDIGFFFTNKNKKKYKLAVASSCSAFLLNSILLDFPLSVERANFFKTLSMSILMFELIYKIAKLFSLVCDIVALKQVLIRFKQLKARSTPALVTCITKAFVYIY